MNQRDITIRRTAYLRGPNIWTYRPVVESWVDIGAFEDFPSNTLPGFNDRLSSWLPGLIEHRCGVGERGGFLLRLKEGTWMAHIMEHVAIELQNLAGMRVGFGKARSTSERGVYKVAVRARNEQVGVAAIEAARELVLAAAEDQPFDVAGTVAALKDLVDEFHLGPSTACIVDGATERHIPAIRLNEGNLVQFGYGCKQHRIWTAETDRTSAIAEGISSDKDLTKRLLAACGVPVPEGEIVATPAAAWEAAQDLGLPVVVKPTDGNHGRGVSVDLSTQVDIEEAFGFADRHGSEVMVERFIRGDEHRLLVVGGKVVAAARGEVAWVTGDGKATVSQLVDTQLNSDPRRGTTEAHPLNWLNLVEDTAILNDLSRQHLTPTSIPEAGRRVLIQRNGNVAFEVTPQVHPDNAALAVLAARIVGLDIAGVDLVVEDISKPLAEQNGAIVEVNAGPGLLMHLQPASGEPQPVGRAIVDHLFPNEEDGRIPIVGITGSQHSSTIARLVAWMMHLSGRYVGLACSDGFYLQQRCVERGNRATWDAGQRVLVNRMVETAVFENSAELILSQGLAYDRCQVGVVTDADGLAALAGYDILDKDQLYGVLRTQVDVVQSNGVAVLNAADPTVAEMAELCDGAVIFYAQDESHGPIGAHRANGGQAVFMRDNVVIHATGTEESVVVELASLPQHQGKPLAPAQVLLPAIASALAMALEPGQIVVALESFAIEPQGLAAAPARKK